MPKGSEILVTHSAFPNNYMDSRTHHNLNDTGELTLKNYEQIYVLLVDSGDYTIEYRRQDIQPLTPWRNRFNLYITICGSLTAFLVYFIIFEGKKFF